MAEDIMVVTGTLPIKTFVLTRFRGTCLFPDLIRKRRTAFGMLGSPALFVMMGALNSL